MQTVEGNCSREISKLIEGQIGRKTLKMLNLFFFLMGFAVSSKLSLPSLLMKKEVKQLACTKYVSWLMCNQALVRWSINLFVFHPKMLTGD